MVPVLVFRWSHKYILCHCPSKSQNIEDDTHADSLQQYASGWWSQLFRGWRGSQCWKFINGLHRGCCHRGGEVSPRLTSGIALLHTNSSAMDIVDNEEVNGWGLSAGCRKFLLTSFSYVMLDITDEKDDRWGWLTGSWECSFISFSYDMLDIADNGGNKRWGWLADCGNVCSWTSAITCWLCQTFAFDRESEHLAWCGSSNIYKCSNPWMVTIVTLFTRSLQLEMCHPLLNICDYSLCTNISASPVCVRALGHCHMNSVQMWVTEVSFPKQCISILSKSVCSLVEGNSTV